MPATILQLNTRYELVLSLAILLKISRCHHTYTHLGPDYQLLRSGGDLVSSVWNGQRNDRYLGLLRSYFILA